MFHKLSWFNIEEGVTEGEVNKSLDLLTEQLKRLALVETARPLGKRCSDIVTDTDEERDQQYFYIMSFSDRKQCERAYAYIENPDPAVEATHDDIVDKVRDAVFICWEDL